ncbi:MAG TPA: hypothetical protein VHJ19_03485 [Gammaproteobacteria bacterium]|nr:hypothetical protein [Gammaproteobacteria bacterium]
MKRRYQYGRYERLTFVHCGHPSLQTRMVIGDCCHAMLVIKTKVNTKPLQLM